MKCEKCGFEHEDNFEFCPQCGIAANAQPEAAEKILSALKDNSFLAICVLLTISCVLSFNVLSVLITIFLWLTYFRAQKGIADAEHLRVVSGCVYANYVITNVGAIIMAVCGVIVSVIFGFFTGVMDIGDVLSNSVYSVDGYAAELIELLFSAAGWLVGVVFVVVSVIMLVINILGLRKIHSFAKAIHLSITNQNLCLPDIGAVKGWLMFFGICSAISALTTFFVNPVSAIATGTVAAANIVASVAVDKFFAE